MSYFIEGQWKTDKDKRMSGPIKIIPFPVLYWCHNPLKRAKTIFQIFNFYLNICIFLFLLNFFEFSCLIWQLLWTKQAKVLHSFSHLISRGSRSRMTSSISERNSDFPVIELLRIIWIATLWTLSIFAICFCVSPLFQDGTGFQKCNFSYDKTSQQECIPC